jgi:hypothetical protein
MVEVCVQADSETDAYLVCEAAVDNMVCGDILNASVYSVNESEEVTQ